MLTHGVVYVVVLDSSYLSDAEVDSDAEVLITLDEWYSMYSLDTGVLAVASLSWYLLVSLKLWVMVLTVTVC